VVRLVVVNGRRNLSDPRVLDGDLVRHLGLVAPEHALLVNHALRKIAKALLDKGEIVERVDVKTGPGQVLYCHVQFPVPGLVLSNLRFAELENSECIAVKSTRSLVEEGIPDAKHRLDG